MPRHPKQPPPHSYSGLHGPCQPPSMADAPALDGGLAALPSPRPDEGVTLGSGALSSCRGNSDCSWHGHLALLPLLRTLGWDGCAAGREGGFIASPHMRRDAHSSQHWAPHQRAWRFILWLSKNCQKAAGWGARGFRGKASTVHQFGYSEGKSAPLGLSFLIYEWANTACM